MTENITYGFVREHSLCGCLSEFSGANGKDDTSLSKPFEALATKMICGGYIKVSELIDEWVGVACSPEGGSHSLAA